MAGSPIIAAKMAGGDGPVAVQPQRLRPGSDADPWAGGGRYERLLEGPIEPALTRGSTLQCRLNGIDRHPEERPVKC
ncbi:MAG TPA: hypothetical protein PKA84_02005, partial [Rubrivivax sp.]|nr:hypothetical protein [Rubrivivax sp.]